MSSPSFLISDLFFQYPKTEFDSLITCLVGYFAQAVSLLVLHVSVSSSLLDFLMSRSLLLLINLLDTQNYQFDQSRIGGRVAVSFSYESEWITDLKIKTRSNWIKQLELGMMKKDFFIIKSEHPDLLKIVTISSNFKTIKWILSCTDKKLEGLIQYRLTWICLIHMACDFFALFSVAL